MAQARMGSRGSSRSAAAGAAEFFGSLGALESRSSCPGCSWKRLVVALIDLEAIVQATGRRSRNAGLGEHVPGGRGARPPDQDFL
jgi:hypothetical protein